MTSLLLSCHGNGPKRSLKFNHSFFVVLLLMFSRVSGASPFFEQSIDLGNNRRRMLLWVCYPLFQIRSLQCRESDKFCFFHLFHLYDCIDYGTSIHLDVDVRLGDVRSCGRTPPSDIETQTTFIVTIHAIL